jgi:LysM repeat protein
MHGVAVDGERSFIGGGSVCCGSASVSQINYRVNLITTNRRRVFETPGVRMESPLGRLLVAQQDQRLEQLKQKYEPAINSMKQSGVHLTHVHVQDNKLFVQGEAPSEQVKNKVWDEIKRIDPSYSDLTCDITVNPSLAQGTQQTAQQTGAAAGGGMQTYTVKAGDSLSKISQQFYGSANQYMKIFEANRDQLRDPNEIRPGQQLKIPA